jgi:hypothetical protein
MRLTVPYRRTRRPCRSRLRILRREVGRRAAKEDACGAVTDIGKQVKQLRNYTVLTVTTDKVKANVNAIKADLKTIKGALPDLESSLKSQLQTAINTFSSKFSRVASNLGSSISCSPRQTRSPPRGSSSRSPTTRHSRASAAEAG